MLSLTIHTLYISFCEISTNRNGDKPIPKILEKVITAPPVERFSFKVDRHIYGGIILNIIFYKILLISAWATLATLLSHTQIGWQIDRRFPEIVKSYSEHPKNVNPSKTRRGQFSRNQYFLLFVKMKVKKIYENILKIYEEILKSIWEHFKKTFTFIVITPVLFQRSAWNKDKILRLNMIFLHTKIQEYLYFSFWDLLGLSQF